MIRTPLPNNNPIEAELISAAEFSRKDDLFIIDLWYRDTHYLLDISEVFEVDMDIERGTINEISANTMMNYMLGMRCEFAIIVDNLVGELNEVELDEEFFMAEKTKWAEDAIQEERNKLIEDKKKKEIGMITQAQVMNKIVLNFSNDYKALRLKKQAIDRNIKKLEKLDKILAHRIDRLNDMLNRQRKTLGN